MSFPPNSMSHVINEDFKGEVIVKEQVTLPFELEQSLKRALYPHSEDQNQL